ncbi:MAG: hypothetical protein A2Y10_09395 [Planctomycetes bacterium GWF2_41_51]|nr:MAG: hypothetical protein A2Y10_09395 [Planctomycetes bacterium GWF2_41_51]
MKNENSLEYIHKLMNENKIEKAMEILNRDSDKSIWAQNTRAVCLMRMNSPQSAVKTLTPIVFPGSSVAVNSEVPDKIKLNLATAMLLSGNIAGALDIIQYCKDNSQYCNKLSASIKKWKKTLPLWSRFMIMLSILPYDKPVAIEPPLGEL